MTKPRKHLYFLTISERMVWLHYIWVKIKPDCLTLLRSSKPGGIQHLFLNFKRPKLFPGSQGFWNTLHGKLTFTLGTMPPKADPNLIPLLVHVNIICLFLLFLTLFPFSHFVVILVLRYHYSQFPYCLINVS